MFALAELKDTIRIAPDQFHLKLVEAIRDEINRKLANKVRNLLQSPSISHNQTFSNNLFIIITGSFKCRTLYSP